MSVNSSDEAAALLSMECDRLREALVSARALLHEFALERGSTDGLKPIFKALNHGLSEPK